MGEGGKCLIGSVATVFRFLVGIVDPTEFGIESELSEFLAPPWKPSGQRGSIAGWLLLLLFLPRRKVKEDFYSILLQFHYDMFDKDCVAPVWNTCMGSHGGPWEPEKKSSTENPGGMARLNLKKLSY